MPDEDSEGANLIDVGARAPGFSLEDQDGQARSLDAYRGKWVVLYFYPKDNTPGCTKEACGFRDRQSKFDELGVVVLGVSPDDAATHAKFAAKHDLSFTLLADPRKEALEAFGVWQEKNRFGRIYEGVSRTTYLIDPEGRVAHRWDKVKVPRHDRIVLETIQELKGE